jgi:biopolymer transport protein ExbD
MGAKVGGGGSGRFELGQNSDINVTPFVDVMLVLLIIFMVSAPLATVYLKVDLPPPTENPPPMEIEPILVNIQSDTELYIGDEEVTLDNLSAELVQRYGGSNPYDNQVMIRAGRYVYYERFMEVLNKLQYDGFTKLGLIAEDL